jgi:O-antigen/teichoic acid export membrane protein
MPTLKLGRGGVAMIDARSEAPSMIRTALDRLLHSRTTHAESWDAVSVFAIRAGSAALLFITQIALARWLGASEYGVFVTAWTCVLVLGALCSLGFTTAMMRLGPQYNANKDYASFRGLLQGGRMVALSSATVIALVGTIVLWIASHHGGTPLGIPMMLAMLCLPIFAFSDVQDGLGRGQGWTVEAIGPAYIVRPIALVMLVPIASWLGFPADAVTGMVIALATLLLAAVLQTHLIGQRVTAAIPQSAPAYDFPTWFKISLPMLAGTMCDMAIANADVLLLAMFRPSEETGIYYAAAKTAALALFIHYAVGTAYAGRIAAARAVGNDEQVRSLVSKAVRWTFIPSATVTIGILAVGYPVLASFGDHFTEAYPLMFILAAGILAKAATGPADTILNMLGHQRASAVSIGIAAFVCVGLNLLLIPLWGTTGAAIATATAITTASVLNWAAARRLEGLNLFVLANLPRSTASED